MPKNCTCIILIVSFKGSLRLPFVCFDLNEWNRKQIQWQASEFRNEKNATHWNPEEIKLQQSDNAQPSEKSQIHRDICTQTDGQTGGRMDLQTCVWWSLQGSSDADGTLSGGWCPAAGSSPAWSWASHCADASPCPHSIWTNGKCMSNWLFTPSQSRRSYRDDNKRSKWISFDKHYAKTFDSLFDSVQRSDQLLPETSGADEWSRVSLDNIGPPHWYSVATDRIVGPSPKVDWGLTFRSWPTLGWAGAGRWMVHTDCDLDQTRVRSRQNTMTRIIYEKVLYFPSTTVDCNSLP